jgi:hypothetical protein
MNSRPHDSSVHTMSVDIRLCGNIPRKEMKEQLLSQPCSLRALTSHQGADSLSKSHLAEHNASANVASTHHTIPFCDKLSAVVLQNKAIMRTAMSVMHERPLTPLCEMSAPSWAVPARKFSQLEVGLDASLLFLSSVYYSGFLTPLFESLHSLFASLLGVSVSST